MAKRDAVLKKPKDTKGTIIRLLKYVADFKWVLAGALILCLTSNILSLLGPYLAGKAIKEAAAGVGKVNFANVYYYAIRMLVFYLSSSALSISINMIMRYMSRRISRKMRKD